MKRRRKYLKRIFLTILTVLTLVMITLTGMTHFSIRSYFSRGDYPGYPVVNYYYEYYQDHYPREEISLYSGNNCLRAYLYGDPNADRLLIFSHGLGSGHENYMNEIIYLVDAGYLVFAYDATGSGMSEGDSSVGALQSALDLDAVFDYISCSDQLRDLPVYLLGHSWGGFAAAEALGRHRNIVAAVSLAGYAYPADLLIYQGSQILNRDLIGMKVFFYISHLITYGPDNFMRNAVDSINSTDIPLLLVHGDRDNMIPLEKTSIIAYQDKLNNPEVQTVVITDEGQNEHNSILHPAEAVLHIAKLNEEFATKMKSIKNFPEEKQEELAVKFREELVENADLPLINQVNKELFTLILNFYDEASHKR